MTRYYIVRSCHQCTEYDEEYDRTGDSPPTCCIDCRRFYPDAFERKVTEK